MEKRCSKCGLMKPLEEFHKSKRGALGRRGDCKVCHGIIASVSQARAYADNKEKILAKNTAWRKANPEKVRESEARGRAARMAEDPERVRKLAAERTKRYRERHPEAVKKDQERLKAQRTADPERFRRYDFNWRAAHPDRVKAKASEFYADPVNRARAKEWAKQWAAENPEKVRSAHEKWRQQNPDRLKEQANKASRQWRRVNAAKWAEVQTRRKRAKQSSPAWGEKLKMAVVYAKAKEWGMEVDHIVPLNHPLVSGLHVWHNLQLLCRADNRKKNNRTWPDMP